MCEPFVGGGWENDEKNKSEIQGGGGGLNSRGNTHAKQLLVLTGREDHVAPANQIITMCMQENVILAVKIDASAWI